MKLSLLALCSLASISSAQGLAGFPPCATECLSSAILAGGCALTDVACQCGTAQTAIGSFAGPCLLASCPATVLVAVQSAGNAQCAAATSPLASTSPTQAITSALAIIPTPAPSITTAFSTTPSNGKSASGGSPIPSMTTASTTAATSPATTSQTAILSTLSPSFSASSIVSGSPIATSTSSAVESSTSSTSSGLSAGAKAGISIGAIFGASIIAAIVILFYLARLRSNRKRGGAQMDIDPGRPELPTVANTHEAPSMDQWQAYETVKEFGQQDLTSSVPYELSASPSANRNTNVFEADSTLPEVELPSPANRHEIGAPSSPLLQRSQPVPEIPILPILSDPGATYLDSGVAGPLPADALSHTSHLSTAIPSSPAAALSSPIPPNPVQGGSLSRLETLQAQMDRVRAQKERLTKLQELEEMEAALQREIMEEQKR